MSDNTAGIQHLEVLQEMAWQNARDERQRLAENVSHLDSREIARIAVNIAQYEGEESMYVRFINLLRRDKDVTTAKRDVLETIHLHAVDPNNPVANAFRTGRIEAYTHIDATFRQA